MENNNELVDLIFHEEYLKLKKDLFEREELKIETTRLYPGSKKIPLKIEEIVFRPSLIRKILILSFLTVLILVFSISINHTNSQVAVVVIVVLLILSLVSTLRYFFSAKHLSSCIKINLNGITFDEDYLDWENVTLTAIMTKTLGKHSNKYLVIAQKKSAEYYVYDLTQYADLNPYGFSSTLSKYIEFLKPKHWA